MASKTKPSATTTTITTTPLADPSAPSTQPDVPPTFAPGPKVSADGSTTFHKDPAREAFDRQWRERVARGEDPLKNLTERVESTGSSSFVEIWWRKATRQEKTKKEEREKREGRGEVGLLEGEGGEDSAVDGRKKERAAWHDRLRWGL